MGHRRRKGDLAPDPEMWAVLGKDGLLRRILERFYDQVFEDERLAVFFEDVTKERAIGKQHAFLMDIFSGEHVYFGDRPRNAHHWMVISDELFDYRESLFRECLQEFELAPELIERWMKVHELFRPQIVKDHPRPKKIRGVELPLEGYDSVSLEVGTLCDGCEDAIDAGATATYHVRTGKTYCDLCSPNR